MDGRRQIKAIMLKYNYFSKFHLDFFYRDKDNERWKDRVSSDLPNSYGEMNIFNFSLFFS